MGLAQDQRVLVRGLRTNFGVRAEDCAGAVWFDEVHCDGGSAACSMGMVAGAQVTGCADVTFTRCSLEGEVGGYDDLLALPFSASGANVVDSVARFLECTITGGWGRSEGGLVSPGPWEGGVGLLVDHSTVTVVGCVIAGGEGGVASGGACEGAHAPGGAGVQLAGADPVLRRADSTIAGGVADLGALCPGMTGPAGPTFTGTGTVEDLPDVLRALAVTSPRRGGETLAFELTGLPGEVPVLLLSQRNAARAILGQACALLLEPPIDDVFVLAPLPPEGTRSLAIEVPTIGTLVGAMTFYAQVLFVDATPSLALGAGASLVLLDPSF